MVVLSILGILVLGATSPGTMRLILLALLIVGVVLILTGGFIALMTLRKRLKVHDLESERR